MSVLDNFEQWKSFLGERLQHAEQEGMGQNTISDLAYQIGGYLAEHVDPKNSQERLLQQMWKMGSEEERHTIANLMIKLVEQEQKEQQNLQ
ncbi:MAG: DUF3243 domain-containing protein [Bacillaceae bacterium]|nr:DUF3243 domain-containing protein [Bacillaceae bacterium]